jgi:hypothetical protein
MSSYLLAIAITNYEPVESSAESKVQYLMLSHFSKNHLFKAQNDMKQLKFVAELTDDWVNN